MNYLAGKNVLVLGLGLSGLAQARWCARYGASVTVADTRPEPPQLQALQDTVSTAKFVHSDMSEALFNSAAFDLVLTSPGLSPASVADVINAAKARGTARGNELSLFAQALADLKTHRGYAPKVIGITGTNGKTTVTSLTGLLVLRAGKSVAVAGNIGPTLLDTLSEKLDHEPEQVVDSLVDDPVKQTTSVRASTPVALLAPEVRHASIKEPSRQASNPGEVANEEFDAAAENDTIDTGEGRSGEATADAQLSADNETPLPLPTAPPATPVFVSLPEVWVLELSSFQLEGVSNFEPTVATVLNVTQDHLDWHETMQAYVAAKSHVYGRGLMLLNRNDPVVMAALPLPLPLVKGKRPPARAYVTFGSDAPQRPGDYGIETVNGMAWLARACEADETIKRRKNEEVVLYVQRLMPMEALRIRGHHNAINALAALALAGVVGCPLGAMLHGLREYRGEAHRVEPVAIVDDVEYFDDSKGTNVGATVAALTGLGADRKLVLIVGGEGKGQDFSPLAEPVARHARAVVLIGRDAPLIKSALQSTGVPLLDAGSMEEAVALAADQALTGDAVLMSPACASFDMFDNYSHRAAVFCDAVRTLALDRGVVL